MKPGRSRTPGLYTTQHLVGELPTTRLEGLRLAGLGMKETRSKLKRLAVDTVKITKAKLMHTLP